MEFQIKKGVLGRGLRDSRMARWDHESYHLKYPGIAPAQNITIMSLAPCLKHLFGTLVW